jgi:plastocyanin
MARKLFTTVAMLALLAAGCTRGGGGDGDAQTYVIDVDARSTPEDKFQFSAYFPGDVRAAAGDTIRFRNRSTEAPHTITFGVLDDRSNQPNIIIPSGENPVVTAPCDIEDDPTNQLVKCDTTELGPYDGEGYWNSGYIQPASAPRGAGRKAIPVQLDEEIPPGNYRYVCILHPLMAGNVQVVEDTADRSTQTDVREGATEAAADAQEKADGLEEPELERDGDEVTVAAGWGDKVTAVNRFGPDEIEIEEGTTVKWKTMSPYEPHTVSFDAPFDSPEDADALAPGGVASGEEYTGGFSSSGIIGPSPFPFDEFELTFTEAGEYEYICVLHPGQRGVVNVT